MDIFANWQHIHHDFAPYLLLCIICGTTLNHDGECIVCERTTNVTTKN